MSPTQTFSSCRGWLVALCLLPLFAAPAAQAGDLKFQAILVWATNAEKSPNPNHKPVGAEVRRKLSELPLKWKNYFEVNRKQALVPSGGSERVELSRKCAIELTDIDGEQVEVSLFGKGEQVLKRRQSLPKGEMLVLGGNAPDETGWLVVLKRVE
jgi:hypothetical protein